MALPRNDDRKLTFEVDALDVGRQHDGIVRREEGRWRLEKNQRFLGRKIIEFSRMVEVIPAEADNLAGNDRRQELYIVQRPGAVRHGPLPEYFSGDFANHVTGDHALQNYGMYRGADFFRRNVLRLKTAKFHRYLSPFCGMCEIVREINGCANDGQTRNRCRFGRYAGDASPRTSEIPSEILRSGRRKP